MDRSFDRVIVGQPTRDLSLCITVSLYRSIARFDLDYALEQHRSYVEMLRSTGINEV